MSAATGGGFNIGLPSVNIASPIFNYAGSIDVGAFARSSAGTGVIQTTNIDAGVLSRGNEIQLAGYNEETTFRGQGPTEDTSSHWFSWDSAPGTFLSKAGSQLGGAAQSFKDTTSEAIAGPIVGAFSSLWNGTVVQDTQQLIDNTGDALWNYDRTANGIWQGVYDTGQGVLAGDPEAAGEAFSALAGGAALKASRGLRLGSQIASRVEKVVPGGGLTLYNPSFAAQQILKNGRVSVNDLKKLVPDGISNTFKPSSTIASGSKFKYSVNGTKLEIKWHAPDAKAAVKFPGSNSGSVWTAQIKVGKKLLGSDGSLYSRP